MRYSPYLRSRKIDGGAVALVRTSDAFAVNVWIEDDDTFQDVDVVEHDGTPADRRGSRGRPRVLPAGARHRHRCTRAGRRGVGAGSMTAIPDLATVKGQEAGKRALEVAAAGGHSVLLIGPYGAGKTPLVRHLPGLLPPLDEQGAAEVAEIYQRSRLEPPPGRPFRSPFPGVSRAGLMGGGSHAYPGEVSLAHCGVLFLDELPEFGRSNLEWVLQALTDGQACVGRSTRLPARFQLIAAQSPCPCGHRGDYRQSCSCPDAMVEKFQNRVRFFLDRMEMTVKVSPPSVLDLKGPAGEPTAAVAARVAAARQIQAKRLGCLNAEMADEEVERCCALNPDGRRLLDLAIDRLSLTDAAVTQTLKIARTLADLDDSDEIRPAHLAEALQYRRRTPCCAATPTS